MHYRIFNRFGVCVSGKFRYVHHAVAERNEMDKNWGPASGFHVVAMWDDWAKAIAALDNC